MFNQRSSKIDRRSLLKTSAALLGGASLGGQAEANPEPRIQNVNTSSSPSKLRITDLRVATVHKPGPSPCTIIRIDTNQGVYGLGEVRDGASSTYALFLKSRLIGENPLNVTFLFEKIKQFGGDARQAVASFRSRKRSGISPVKFTVCPSIRCWAANFVTASVSTPTLLNRKTSKFTPSA